MTFQQTQTCTELSAMCAAKNARLNEIDAELRRMEAQAEEDFNEDAYNKMEDEFLAVLLELRELDGTGGEFKIFD